MFDGHHRFYGAISPVILIIFWFLRKSLSEQVSKFLFDR